MAYMRVSIGRWTEDAAGDEGVVRKVQDEGVPVLRGLPGFVSFQSGFPDARTSVTVIVWQTEEQCRSGSERWTGWLQSSGIGQRLSGTPEVFMEEITASS